MTEAHTSLIDLLGVDDIELTEKVISILEDNGYKVIRPAREVKDDYTFDNAWDLYEKKVGCKDKLKKKWNSMTKADRKAATEFIPLYVLSTPDRQYRKNFQTFLNQRGWEDEIIGAERPATAPPAVLTEDDKSIGERWQEAKTQATDTAKADKIRSVICNMMEEVKKKPRSPLRRSLENYYLDGTMARLGIDWNPLGA
jgi:hypothetical protein